jgi:hypothetical protein
MAWERCSTLAKEEKVNIKGTGKMIADMVKVSLFTKMEISIQVGGDSAKNTEKVPLFRNKLT